MTALRRLLSRRVSVEAMVETVMWLSIPYLIVGLVWAFFDAEQVRLIETELQGRLPAGSEILAFVLTAALWPVLALGVNLCTA